jgi:hypothetical protein
MILCHHLTSVVLILLLKHHLVEVSSQASIQYYVDSVRGRDIYSGTSPSFPFATLAKAAAAVARRARPFPTVVNILGEFALSEPLTLNASHSNTVWRSYSSNGQDPARIHGGYRIYASSFTTFQGPILVASLPQSLDLGEIESDLSQSDLGDLFPTGGEIENVGDLAELIQLGNIQSGGLRSCANSKAEVVWNGNMLTLARYPNVNKNENDQQWLRIRRVISPDSFTYTNASAEGEPIQFSEDLWVHGYWNYDWADNYLKVKSIINDVIQIDTSTSPVLYNLTRNARFYALNSLDLLDAPGEYFIDRDNYKLYIYPPSNSTPEQVYVANAPTLIVAENLTNVQFDNIIFGISQSTALVFRNATSVSFRNSSIANVGGSYAILFDNVSNSIVSNVQMSKLSCAGIGVLRSGNRTTLQKSGVVIRQNRIFDYARWKRTYAPGIYFLDSCGHQIMFNEIFDAPHQGIAGRGNDVIIRGNYLHDLCYETSDSGAFYTGRSYAERGNVIAFNVFERIRTTLRNSSFVLGFPSVQAIYLDDQMSGFSVIGNDILDSDTGILIGGGRDHRIVSNNRFINVDLPFFFDKRGLADRTRCDPGGSFELELEAYRYRDPPWSIRYPELLTTFVNNSTDSCAPANNFVREIQFCRDNNLSSSWIRTPSTSLEELVLWNNTFLHIAKDFIPCGYSSSMTFSTKLGNEKNFGMNGEIVLGVAGAVFLLCFSTAFARRLRLAQSQL